MDRKLVVFQIVCIVLLFFVVPYVFSTTYYVDGGMADNSGDGISWGTAKKTIGAGIGSMSGGDTLYVKDGTYTGTLNRIYSVPSGTAGDYTEIYAENDWGVTLSATGGDAYQEPIDIVNNYIEIRGFKITNRVGNNCNIAGDYVKVIRCASDGIGSGAAASFAADGNYNLFEECYSWGAGRYPMRTMKKSAQYVIFRRCVVRWDYSNTDEPYACFGNYECANVYFQNCIAIDGKDNRALDYLYDGLMGYLTPNGAEETHFTGCFALNMEGIGYYIDDSPVMEVTLTDCVAWDSKDTRTPEGYIDSYTGYLMFVRPDDDGGPFAADHCTFGVSDYGKGITIKQPLPNDTVENSIIYGVTLSGGEYALNGAAEDYNSFYGNTGDRNRIDGIGSNSIDNINPLSNSLLYLTRIENSSDLDGAANDGGDIGATILKKVGVSGTLYGEAGWDTVTNENLWPFPNEDEMRADMKAFSMAPDEAYAGSPAMSGDRGFCVDGMTLTKYIWEYLGNPMPNFNYPYVSGLNPDANATDVSADTKIIFHVKHDSAGVDGLSVVIRIDDENDVLTEVYNGSNPFPTKQITAWGTCTREGSINDFVYTCTPKDNFQHKQIINIEVEAMDTAEEPNIMPKYSCFFEVCLGSNNGDEDEENCYIRVIGSTEGKGTINPNKGDVAKIYFKGERVGKYKCRIFTLNGELVWKETKRNVQEGSFEWSASNVSSGTYVVHVKGPGLNAKKKIIVIK